MARAKRLPGDPMLLCSLTLEIYTQKTLLASGITRDDLF